MPAKLLLVSAIIASASALYLAEIAAAVDDSSPAAAGIARMVEEEVMGAGIEDARVIDAMRKTPRQEFVPASHRQHAFEDMALPIGEGQTISPPFVVAYMTEQLAPQPTDRVLEVGTGSGYQAAVLSPLVRDVYTIEIHEALGKAADATLTRLGYQNIHRRVGDGYQGWPEAAPFDKIVVTCSPEKVPQPLVDQLREGGRLIVPVGERFQQTLYLFRKVDGQLVSQPLQPTMFVPMTGVAEQQRSVLPDATKPALRGGSFEAAAPNTPAPEGWYYVRRGKVSEDETAPDGRHVMTFANEVPGRSARALQALAIDGRAISQLDVSMWMRGRDIREGTSPAELPQLVVTFYGEDRVPLGEPCAFGGATGTFDWRQEDDRIPVPSGARMAIVWIGLLGATGEVSFDQITLVGRAGNPSILPAAGRSPAIKPTPR